MRVVCAWCEKEGRPAVLREDKSRDASVTTHGICEDHRLKVLYEIRTCLRGTWTVSPMLGRAAARAGGSTLQSVGTS